MSTHRRKSMRLRLPELSPREAAAVSYFLDQLDLALWSLYGNTMVRLCEREGVPLLTDSQSEQTTVRKRER